MDILSDVSCEDSALGGYAVMGGAKPYRNLTIASAFYMNISNCALHMPQAPQHPPHTSSYNKMKMASGINLITKALLSFNQYITSIPRSFHIKSAVYQDKFPSLSQTGFSAAPSPLPLQTPSSAPYVNTAHP